MPSRGIDKEHRVPLTKRTIITRCIAAGSHSDHVSTARPHQAAMKMFPLLENLEMGTGGVRSCDITPCRAQHVGRLEYNACIAYTI